MATVTIAERNGKRGKRYIIQFVNPDTGRKEYFRSAKTKKEAVSEAANLRVLLETGKRPAERKSKQSAASQRFSEVADLLEADWESRFDKGRLSRATLDGYRVNLKMVEKAFGNSLIAVISAKQVEKYLHDTANPEGERRVGSPALANRRLFIIKKVVELALKQEIPADKEILEIHYYSEKKHERATYLSPAQVDRLIKVAKEGNASHYLPLAILLAVEHGASKQEILDLKWQAIRFTGDGGTIHFHRTKNGIQRLHDIMPRTLEALKVRKAFLEQERESRGIVVADDYVVGHLDGSRMLDFKASWQKVRKQVGMPDLHFHDNRHTYCSNLLEVGATLKDIKEMIGHRDLRSTNRYSHLSMERYQGVQSLLAQRYAGM